MKELVSIIVPAYNVEKYISRCLDSLIRQTYQDIEIVLIDDGSTDNTYNICKKYSNKDKRIRLIHKENGGLSSARNEGINNSRGTYLSFVDSDDWVEYDFIESLVKSIEENSADISIVNCYSAYDTGKKIAMFPEINKVLNKNEAIHHLFVHDYYGCMVCQKMFKKSLFNNVRFPVGELYEDVAVSLDLFRQANFVALFGMPKYYYFQRSNSITSNKLNKEKLQLLYNVQKYIDFSKRNNEFIDESESFYLKSIMTLLLQGYGNNQSDYESISYCERELKKYRKKILNNQYIERRKKIIMFLISCGFSGKIMSLLWKTHMYIKRQ